MDTKPKSSSKARKKEISPVSSEQSLLSDDQEEYVVTEYIMEYTDIFEPSQNKMDFVDIQEGDAISEVSDEEIVAHSGEHEVYDDPVDETEDHETLPPPLGDSVIEGYGKAEDTEDTMRENGTTEEVHEHSGNISEEDAVGSVDRETIVDESINVTEVERNGRQDSVEIESQDELSLSQGTENEVEEQVNSDEIEERVESDEHNNDDNDEDDTTEVDKLIDKKQECDTKTESKQRKPKANVEEEPLLVRSDSSSPEPQPAAASPEARNQQKSPSLRTKRRSSPSSNVRISSPSVKSSSPSTPGRKGFTSKAYPGKVVKSGSNQEYEQDISKSPEIRTSKRQTQNIERENNTEHERDLRMNKNNRQSAKSGTGKQHSRENGATSTAKQQRVRVKSGQSSDANFFRACLPQTSKRHPKRHVWLCRDSEIHRLIAEKAAILRRYKEEGITGRNRFKDKGFPHYSEVDVLGLPSVGFSGQIKDDSHRSSLPYSRHPSSRATQGYSSPHRAESSSEDEDEITNRLGTKGGKPSGGTFAVGLAARRENQRTVNRQDEHVKDDHLSDDGGDGCELCAAEAREKEKHENKLKELEAAAKAGPHHPRNLMLGIVYSAKFLGSTNLMSPNAPDKSVRLQQAQEAIARIKVPQGEEQPSSDVDLFISTERIKVVSADNKQPLLDHHLKTISFIADIGNIIVVMARLEIDNDTNVWSGKMPDFKTQNAEKTAKVCHVLETNEAQVIAKTVGQAFSIAYHEFLKVNQLSLDEIETAEYNGILEQQKILGEELSLLADEKKSKEVVIHKKYGESLSIMIVESGWGSMIPTVIIAHLDNKGAAVKSGQLNVGNQILSVNGQSLVGLPLLDCQNMIRAMKYEERVALKVVCCPPTVEISVNRPDTKYQLGFSVQNGMICSLMRGGIAERGGVRVGHKIIELNGESVVTASHHYIVDILQTKIGELRMKTMPITLYKLLVGLEVPQYL